MLKKKKSARYTRKKADILFSQIVRKRGYCEKCGSTYNLNCAHIISRRYTATRFREDNCFCLCHPCHFYFTYHPLEFEEFVISKIGEAKYQQLKVMARQITKVDYKELIEKMGAQ